MRGIDEPCADLGLRGRVVKRYSVSQVQLDRGYMSFVSVRAICLKDY